MLNLNSHCTSCIQWPHLVFYSVVSGPSFVGLNLQEVTAGVAWPGMPSQVLSICTQNKKPYHAPSTLLWISEEQGFLFHLQGQCHVPFADPVNGWGSPSLPSVTAVHKMCGKEGDDVLCAQVNLKQIHMVWVGGRWEGGGDGRLRAKCTPNPLHQW